MGLFGHDNAAVLDGGLPKWQREGRNIATGEPPPPEPTTYRPDYRAAKLRGVGDMLNNVVTRTELVLDARAGGVCAASSAAEACANWKSLSFVWRETKNLSFFITRQN